MHESVLGLGVTARTRSNTKSDGLDSWPVKNVCPHTGIHVHTAQRQPSATDTCMPTAQPARANLGVEYIAALCTPSAHWLAQGLVTRCSHMVGCD